MLTMRWPCAQPLPDQQEVVAQLEARSLYAAPFPFDAGLDQLQVSRLRLRVKIGVKARIIIRIRVENQVSLSPRLKHADRNISRQGCMSVLL